MSDNAHVASMVRQPSPARPSFAEVWMDVASVIARRATCPRLHVGAVIVGADGRVKGTGYNGSASGMEHCEDVGCVIEPETGRCKRTVHAEINALLFTTPEERAGGTMYITAEPCEACTAAILNSGLVRVVYRDAYPHREPIRAEWAAMIGGSDVEFVHVEDVIDA